MAARDHERDGRVLDLGVVKGNGVDVPLDVVDADERLSAGVRERLRVADADEQRADEPRSARDGDSVDLVDRDARLVERLVDDRADLLEVLARRDLGHDAPVDAVRRDLRRDDVRANMAAVLDDGRRGLIARRLDAEHQAHRYSTVTETILSPLRIESTTSCPSVTWPNTA